MHVFLIPIVDEKNPFYCPAIPAAQYLKLLRGRSRKPGQSHRRLDLFARKLERSTRTEDADYYAPGLKQSSVQPKHLESVTGELVHHSIQRKPVNYVASSKRFQNFSLKRKLSFSDLGAPPKHARSPPSFHDSSFDIEVQHEKLEYFPNTSQSSPQRAPHHARAERPDIETLADRLDSALPGIRLRERLLGLKSRTPEAFMDLMSENGVCILFTTVIKIYSYH